MICSVQRKILETSGECGTARHLVVAARTRRRLLWVRDGFTGAHSALVIAPVEQACR